MRVRKKMRKREKKEKYLERGDETMKDVRNEE